MYKLFSQNVYISIILEFANNDHQNNNIGNQIIVYVIDHRDKLILQNL